MTLTPPHFPRPRPGSDVRNFLRPPQPGMTTPESGSFINACCNLESCSSGRYSFTHSVNSWVSMNAFLMLSHYVDAIPLCGRNAIGTLQRLPWKTDLTPE